MLTTTTCPHCHGQGSIVRRGNGKWVAGCLNCLCETSEKDSKTEAEDDWKILAEVITNNGGGEDG